MARQDRGKSRKSAQVAEKDTSKAAIAHLPTRAVSIAGVAPTAAALEAPGPTLDADSRAVELWLTADDVHLNVLGDIFPNGASQPIQSNVHVYQGNDGTDVVLPCGLYEYHFYVFNGQGSFVLHTRDPDTRATLSPDGQFDGSYHVGRIYFFEVPAP